MRAVKTRTTSVTTEAATRSLVLVYPIATSTVISFSRYRFTTVNTLLTNGNWKIYSLSWTSLFYFTLIHKRFMLVWVKQRFHFDQADSKARQRRQHNQLSCLLVLVNMDSREPQSANETDQNIRRIWDFKSNTEFWTGDRHAWFARPGGCMAASY